MLLAIISDIHSDFPSLEKALGRINRMDLDRVICLGDIVGYGYHYADVLDGRDPDACCRLVRENCHIVICGNHDLHAMKKMPSNFKELGIPDNWYEMDLDERSELSAGRFWLYDDELEHRIEPSSEQYLSSLRETYTVLSGQFRIMLTHFIAPDICGVTQGSPSSRKEFRQHLRLLRKDNCLVGIAGHAHLEGYVQVSRNHYFMNYFGNGKLIDETQVIIGPAITRGSGRNGFLLMDTENKEFEAIPLDTT